MEAMEVPGVISCQNKALTTPLLFDPGERWFYGINIDWAGKMVEAASGKKLGQYMRDNILGPLGMDSTGFTHHRQHAPAPGQDPSSRRPTARCSPTPRSSCRRNRNSRWAAAASTARPAIT